MRSERIYPHDFIVNINANKFAEIHAPSAAKHLQSLRIYRQEYRHSIGHLFENVGNALCL